MNQLPKVEAGPVCLITEDCVSTGTVFSVRYLFKTFFLNISEIYNILSINQTWESENKFSTTNNHSYS